MKAFIIHGDSPMVIIKDGNKIVKTYVLSQNRVKWFKDVLDPLNWCEGDRIIFVPGNAAGVFVGGSELWYAMNVYLTYLKNH